MWKTPHRLLVYGIAPLSAVVVWFVLDLWLQLCAVGQFGCLHHINELGLLVLSFVVSPQVCLSYRNCNGAGGSGMQCHRSTDRMSLAAVLCIQVRMQPRPAWITPKNKLCKVFSCYVRSMLVCCCAGLSGWTAR